MLTPAAVVHLPTITPSSAVAELTGRLLDAERVRSEWVLNRVRAVVLLLLTVASALYAGELTAP